MKASQLIADIRKECDAMGVDPSKVEIEGLYETRHMEDGSLGVVSTERLAVNRGVGCVVIEVDL